MPTILDPLVQTAVNEIKVAVSSKSLLPEDVPYFRWKTSKFEHSDEGVDIGTANGTHYSRPSWRNAYRVLHPLIASQEAYKKSVGELTQIYPDQAAAIPGFLDKLISRILGTVLSDGGNYEIAPLEPLCENFLNELAGGPIIYRAKVLLNGLVLKAESIQVAVGVRLRRPTREDIEIESQLPISVQSAFPIVPQAIAEIQYPGARGQNADLQREVEHAVAILRLFGVGSVGYTTYEMSSDSTIDFMGGAIATIGSPRLTGRERYVIRHEDEDRLKAFWRAMAHAIPKDIYDFQKQVSPITLAYDRYSDAVLNNGIVERRIANTVMGLEALLLDETQELSYRLGMRIAKALSLVGRKPLEVRHRIHDAYRIRSLFAHGGHLSYKEKSKIERTYASIEKFMLPLFDYLRSLIVLMISVHCDKEELIDWLDDALIDPERHETLKGKLAPLASIVSEA